MVFIFIIAILCIENKHIQVSYYTYCSEKIGDEASGYRIVQISDLHNANFGKNNKRLLRKIETLNPDIIVITGDVVDSNHTDIDRAIRFVEDISAICKVYYVTGNHEYWLSDTQYMKLITGIKNAGAKVLNNEAVSVKINNFEYSLIGLDDRNLNDSTLLSITKENNGKLSILLAHEPQYLSQYASAGVDLVLSGHAHGGQFRLPIIGAVVAPDQGLLPKYTAGEYFDKNTEMIVSRGLGNSVIPLRVFNNPEIVCVELK